ncbi:MAG: hypothetical protein DRQ39_08565 [Gammaproteobacteria bacterium]|nr:MAG: hypothetical protein DRQ39_08565 [Gammaproteobacteria bacterium]
MAAVSEVSICNQALLALGADAIISLDDDTTEAKLCKAHYDHVRDAVIEAHNWTFAVAWVQLAKLASPPLSEYANAFQLPVEAVRVIFVGEDYDHPNVAWQVQGNTVVTNETSCKCQLIQIVTNPEEFSPLFVQALAARLSADLAIAITNSRSLFETHMQVYALKIKEAASMDGMQGKARRIRSKWLNNSRSQGPHGAGPMV